MKLATVTAIADPEHPVQLTFSVSRLIAVVDNPQGPGAFLRLEGVNDPVLVKESAFAVREAVRKGLSINLTPRPETYEG